MWIYRGLKSSFLTSFVIFIILCKMFNKKFEHNNINEIANEYVSTLKDIELSNNIKDNNY